MSFLKWLFEDSKSTPPEEPKPTLQQELDKIRNDVEEKIYTEAYEWFLSVKDEIINECIVKCREEASKGKGRSDFECVSYRNGHDFTYIIINELRNKGLKATWIYRGCIEVRW